MIYYNKKIRTIINKTHKIIIIENKKKEACQITDDYTEVKLMRPEVTENVKKY